MQKKWRERSTVSTRARAPSAGLALQYREKVHYFCNLFQKVKLSYILDSLHVK